MTDWITDRLPTRADADQSGNVIACKSPTLHKELITYMDWRDVRFGAYGWPWHHTEYWTPPTPAPEPTPAAPEPEPGGWITRPPTLEDADCNGNVEYSYLCVLSGIKNEYINWRLLTPGSVWRHTSLWKPPTPAAPKPEPKPETEQWITDRPPTKKDADAVDHVLIRRHPDSPFTWHVYWQYATGAPWRHTDLWWDPWGENSNSKSEPPTVCKNCYTSYDSTEPRCPNCGFGFVPEPEPEPEKAARGFTWFYRVDVNQGHEVEEYAVATDGTAWWRMIGKNDRLKDVKWIQVRPLPQPGEE